MDTLEVMRTTFAARDYTDRPLDDATLHRILDHARFAPSGGTAKVGTSSCLKIARSESN